MILSNQDKLERLVKAFDKDREADAASVLEKWRDEIEAEEKAHIEAVQSRFPPVAYGFELIGEQIVQDGGEHRKSRYIAGKFVVKEADLATFAREHGLTKAQLMDIALGKVQEINNIRGHVGGGLYNVLYVDRSKHIEQREMDRAEDERVAKRAAWLKEVNKQAKIPALPGWQEYKPVER